MEETQGIQQAQDYYSEERESLTPRFQNRLFVAEWQWDNVNAVPGHTHERR